MLILQLLPAPPLTAAVQSALNDLARCPELQHLKISRSRIAIEQEEVDIRAICQAPKLHSLELDQSFAPKFHASTLLQLSPLTCLACHCSGSLIDVLLLAMTLRSLALRQARTA